MSRSADLCQYDLPNGKLCRQIALKNEQLCRHHRRLHRHSDAQNRHMEAMEILAARLESLPLPELLLALQAHLNRVHRAVRGVPEARLNLDIALRRLEEENTAASGQLDPHAAH
jgi:hypothetical protein